MTAKSRKTGITLALACLLLNMQIACYSQTAPEESAPDSLAVPRFSLPAVGSIPGENSALETSKPVSKPESRTIFSGFRKAVKPAGTSQAAANSSEQNKTSTAIESSTARQTESSKTSTPAASTVSSVDLKSNSGGDSSTSSKPADSPVSRPSTTKSSLAAAALTASIPVIKSGQVMAQEFVLPNGLKVLIQENHEFPVVSTLVFYRVGSRDEQTGSTGLTHMVEHLMFQEVGNFKAGDIGSMIARVGGQFNGYTSDDFTTFFETLPSSRLEMALKIESDRMARTKFSASEVKQEVANIQKELEAESKDPQALLSKEVRAMMFMQHPYHNPTIGWKTDVEGLTAETARNFYSKYFSPSNATLVISGDVYFRQASQLVQKYFATINGAEKASHVSVTESMPRSERRVNTKYDGNKELMQVAYRAPAMDDPDAPAMVVMEKLLNGGIVGRLKGRLVDSKICSSTQANYEIKKEPGLFTVSCTAVPATFNAQSKILEGVDSVVSQVRDKLPSDAEVRRARNQAEFAYFAECDGPYRAGFHLGYFECLDKWQDNYSWAEKLRAVSAADINRVAKKYFSPETRVIGWISGSSAPKAAPPAPAAAPSPKASVPDTKHGALATCLQGQNIALFDEQFSAKPSYSRNMEHLTVAAYKETDEIPAPDASSEKTTVDSADNASGKPGTVLSGTAQKISPKSTKKTGIPAVIRDIPNALGNAVTGNIPGAVGNVGAALINLPVAIGDIGVAVGSTASALGKQIVALKPGALESDSKFVSQRVLKNGLKVVVYESHVSPIVQVSGSIQAGEAYSKSKTGYSLLSNSILSLGSSRRNKAQSQSLQDDLGISPQHMLKFDSNLETIDFSTRCLSRDFSQQLDLIADNLSSPLIDEANLEKAKADASYSLKHNQDFVGKKVNRLLLQGLLDDNSPFCPTDPSDRAKTIAQADLAETQKFFSSHITPAATTIVLAGDLNPETVFAQMERSFGKWANKGAHNQLKAKLRTQRVLRSSLPLKDSKKSNICFGQLVPMAESHPEYGSLLIADCILVNHPMISRFEQALSKNPALESAIANGEMTVKLEPFSNLTQWSMSLFLDPAAVQVSVRTIKNELKQISKLGVTAEEFTEAKRYLLGSLPVRTQATLGEVSSSMLDSYEHSDTINGYNAEIASVKAASVDSVNKVIRTIFKPEQSTIVIAGGGQSIKAARNPSESSESKAETETSPSPSKPSPEKKVAPKPSSANKPADSSKSSKSKKDDAKSVGKVKK